MSTATANGEATNPRMQPSILRQSPVALRTLGFLRPRIIDRYLLREVATSFLAATAILLLVMVGGAVADLLSKIARGRIPADLLFTLIGLRAVGTLTILMPLAALLGVLLAYGRLWRDSEMAVLQSSGLDLGGLMRPLLLFAVPTMAAIGLISFWLGPASDRLAQQLMTEASRSLIVAGLEPGKFVDLPGRDGVIYVGEMSADGTQFKRMFIESERADKEPGKIRIDVVTATHGFLYHDADGVGRYIALQDGFRVEGKLGEDDFRLMRFARNDIKLPDSASDDNATSAKRSAPTSVLLGTGDDLVMRAELHWRLAAPLSVLVLTLLALPLSKSSPREPRYARLLIALLVWLIYYNALLLGRSWISQGRLAPEFGLWWVYLPAIAIAVWLLLGSQRLKRPRAMARVA
jgi:lipopolysaccharide export system permease protein